MSVMCDSLTGISFQLMGKRIRVALVEDHENFRGLLMELVDKADGLELIANYKDGISALKDIPLIKPDVVIMDIQLPGMNGVDCVRTLKALLPQTNFLMLTAHEESERIFESLKAGASGYLLKRTLGGNLREAVEEINSGGSPMTPQIARRVTQYFLSTQNAAQKTNAELEQLTPGQKKFLDELAQGFSYKEIADHLGITVHGVRNYIRKIYEKLQVHSRTEAVIKYLNR
jgi:DNA-binding NarL/FixJ family response regulator